LKLAESNIVRVDGRKPDELRPIRMEVGLLPNANGSAYIEQGKSKIIVAVYGPREVHPKHLGLSQTGLLYGVDTIWLHSQLLNVNRQLPPEEK